MNREDIVKEIRERHSKASASMPNSPFEKDMRTLLKLYDEERQRIGELHSQRDFYKLQFDTVQKELDKWTKSPSSEDL